jgi:iron complex transport system ATP-binding protein
MLSVQNIRFAYKKRPPTLNGVSFDIPDGEVAALLGPNGTGKTTLLRCMLGLAQPSDGRVLYDGQNLLEMSPEQRAKIIAYVPQNSSITFPYSVQEVVLMGRIPHLGFGQAPKVRDLSAVEEALSTMGIEHLAVRKFQDLSGGEKQLVLISRALAQQAKILVLDEPTASLDFANQCRTLNLIRSLKEKKFTVLFSTHSPDHAFLASDAIIMLKGGRLFAHGAPDDVITRKTLTDLYGVPAEVVTTAVKSAGRFVKVCIPTL